MNEFFCDKLLTCEQPQICGLCNVTLFSANCAQAHRKVCNGKGHFGWKCDFCNKFTYRYGSETSADIKKNHICGEGKKCRYCFETMESDHLCKLIKVKYPSSCPKLGYLSIVFLSEATITNEFDQPFIIATCVEKDCSEGLYDYKLFSDETDLIPNISSIVKLTKLNFAINNEEKQKKPKEDFVSNMARLQRRKNSSIIFQLLYYLLANINTTFICSDENSVLMV